MIAEISDIASDLREKMMIFSISLSVGLSILVIAWRQGFFRVMRATSYPAIRGIDVFKGFAFFLLAEIFVVPVFIAVLLKSAEIDFKQLILLQPEMKGWLNLMIMTGGFIAIFFSYFSLSLIQRHQLWNQTSTPWWTHLAIGILGWVVSYPLVLALSQGLSISLWYVFQQPFVEQVAVQNVRRSMENPLLFALTSLSVVIVVPLTEEFLFRGLLQSWLKRKFGTAIGAILFSSFIFACFHYSNHHGIMNIELLPSLFVLSCMLGYLFERQQSLWASLGLHGFFNFMSLLLIYQGGIL